MEKKKTIATGDLGEAANGTDKRAITEKSGAGFRRPKPFLSSIADCVAGQESQFADFLENVFLGLAPTKENILEMYSTFFGVMNPRNHTSKHVRSHMFKVKILLVFSVVSFADVCIKRSSKFDKMDEILLSIVNTISL